MKVRLIALLAVPAAVLIPASKATFGAGSPGVCMPAVAAIAPPAGFDAVHASDADLQCYGFPRRPRDPTMLQEWIRIMSKAKYYVYPASALNNPVGEGASYGGYASGNWAGYHARANQNTQWPYTEWDQASGETVVRTAPTTSSSNCVGKVFGQWVGLGGDTSGTNLSQDGVEQTAGNPPKYRLWWQNASNMSPVTITEVPVSAGNWAYLSVTYNIGYASSTFYAENESTYVYTSFTKGAGDPSQDVDFDMEEPLSWPGGPFVNFPHIVMDSLFIHGWWGSSHQYELNKNLDQVNYIHDTMNDSSNHVVVDPNAVDSEYRGFDLYANSNYTPC